MSIPPGLHDSISEEGIWWVAGHEDNEVAGTLTYDPDNGAKLNLLGTLSRSEHPFDAVLAPDDNDDDVTIHGITKKGKQVTLLDAMNINRQFNMPGIANETWSSNLLVLGQHMESAEQEIFSKSYSRFDGIEDWLGHRPFVAIRDHEEMSVTLKASKPKEEHFADHAEFKVTTVGSLYSSNTPDTRYTIDVISQFGVTPDRPRSLNWHLSKATGLQKLGSLCSGHYRPLTSFELRGPVPADSRSERPSEVHVYSRLMHAEAEKRPKRARAIISASELVSHTPEAVQKWFDQYEVFQPAIALFFTVTGQREMFVNVRFLLAIQALEVFHRRTNSETVMSPDTFPAFAEDLIAAIPATTDSRMKEKLKGTYRFLNELSLMQRLKSIIADLSTEFGASPPAFDKAYLRKMVDTRNYYTHFSAELEDKTLDGGGMHWGSRRIVLLLTLLFLMRLGLKGGDISPLLERHEEFSRLWASNQNPF